MSAPIFLQRRFFPMWAALTLGALADNMLRQSVLIGVSYGAIKAPFGAGDAALPWIGALIPLAIMTFTAVSGQLADKYETSLMFRRTKGLEVVLVAIAGLALLSNSGTLAIAMLFAMGVQSAFFSPVRTGAMPKYLSTDELLRGNALCNLGLFGAILSGYAIGGFLIVEEGGRAAVAAALLACSLAGFFAARFTPFAAANDPGLKLSFNWLRQIGRMRSIVFSSPGVAPPLLGVASFYFLSTAVTVATPLIARDALHGTAHVATLLNALFAVGAGIGAITAASLSRGASGLGWSTASVGLAGVAALSVYAIAPLVAPEAGLLSPGALLSDPAGIALCVLMTVCAALMGIYLAPLQAALQRRAPAAVRARIMASSAFANALFAIPGSLTLILVVDLGVDSRFILILAAVGMLALSALMLHRKRVLPAGLYDEMLAGR
jgi:MFS family permease